MLRQSIVFFSSFFFGDLKQRLGTNVCFLFPLFIVVALFTNTLLVPPCVCLCLGWLVVSTLPFSSVIFCSVPFRVSCYVLSSSLVSFHLFTHFFVFLILISSFLLFPTGCLLHWHRCVFWGCPHSPRTT